MPPPAASKVPPGPRGLPSMMRWGFLSLLIVLVTGLLFSWHSLTDLDIWFHLRSGRDLLDGQGVTAVNRYSFTEPDHPWVNHEWLFQILAVATGPEISSPTAPDIQPNVTGWNVLRSSLVFLLLITLLLGDGGTTRFLRPKSGAAAAWSGLAFMAGLMLLWTRFTLRPELFSYLFFVLLIRWTEQFLRVSTLQTATLPAEPGSGRRNWKIFFDPRHPGGRIFLLTVIWAQFHGFASLVPPVLVLGGVLAQVQARWYRSRPVPDLRPPGFGQALILAVLTLMALMMTPNGWNGLLMPLRAVGQFSQSQVDLRTTVSELVPLLESPNSLGLTIMMYRASLVWGILWIVYTAGRVSLLRILVFVLAAWAAWANQRSLGFYGLAFILVHLGLGAQDWRPPLIRKIPSVPPVWNAAAGLVVTLLLAGWLWPSLMSDDFYLREGVGRRFGSGMNPARYPVTAAADMGRLGTPRYFANLDAAAFLLAHNPGQIFIDGRTEAYSADLWAEYVRIKRGDEKALQLLTERRVDAICLATGGSAFHPLAASLLHSPEWELKTAETAGLLFCTPKNNATPGARTSGAAARDLLDRAAELTLATVQPGSSARQADLCLAAGRLFEFAGNRAEQEDAYRRGLSLRSDHPTLNHNLGNILLNREDYQEALPHFQKAVGLNPRLVGSALNAGVCQMRLGLPDEAARLFRQAIDIDPDKFEAWANLSSALYLSGDRVSAIKALQKAMNLRPGDRVLEQRLRQWRLGIPD